MFVELSPLSMTVRLIEEFVKYRQTKQEHELASAEWQNLEKEYIVYLAWRFRHQRMVFTSQLVATVLLTVLVVGLVVSGLVFAFVQLQVAIQRGDISSLQTEMAVETAGRLSVGSSVVGAVVLVISLLFFHLYLKHVFRIAVPTVPHIPLSDTDAPVRLPWLQATVGGIRELSTDLAPPEELGDEREDGTEGVKPDS
jgi:hypothetical protein